MESIFALMNCVTFDNVRVHIVYVISILICAVSIYYSTLFLKYKVTITIECWFCLQKCLVIYANKNSWYCKYCNQYNGFNNDGSYNKSMDEHFQDSSNVYYCKRYDLIKYEQHRLCDNCNKNEEIKIKMLADFIPLDERYFDKEIADFKKHLDSLYQICDQCDLLISKLIDRPKSGPNSSLYQNPHYKQEEKHSKYFSNNLKRSLKTIWIVISDLFILLILFFMYCQSYNAFVFKNFATDFLFLRIFPVENIEYHQYYLSSVMSGFVLFLTLTCLNYNSNLYIDYPLLLLWISLILNHFKCNIFSLNHDQLVQCQQYLFALQMLFTTIHLIYTIFGHFFINNKTNTKVYSPSVKMPKKEIDKKKCFYFEQIADQTNDVRKQIKQLSLADKPSGGDNLLDSTNINSLFDNDYSSYNNSSLNHSNNNFAISDFKLFYPSSTKGTVNSIPKSVQKQTHCNFSCVYNFPNVFSNIVSTNSFLENSQLIANNYTKNYHFNVIQSYSHNNPRVLNYFADHDLSNRSNNNSLTEVGNSSSSKLTLYSNMLHSFVLILFLVILFSIVVILSLPISMNYNSNGDSFIFKILVNNCKLFDN